MMKNQYDSTNEVLEIIDFWEELKDEFVWDLLPSQFLYDLYVKWSERNNPHGSIMSRLHFISILEAYIRDSNGQWIAKTKADEAVLTANLLEKDEPLITTYGLDMYRPDKTLYEWLNYRHYEHKKKYHGFVRKK